MPYKKSHSRWAAGQAWTTPPSVMTMSPLALLLFIMSQARTAPSMTSSRISRLSGGSLPFCSLSRTLSLVRDVGLHYRNGREDVTSTLSANPIARLTETGQLRHGRIRVGYDLKPARIRRFLDEILPTTPSLRLEAVRAPQTTRDPRKSSRKSSNNKLRNAYSGFTPSRPASLFASRSGTSTGHTSQEMDPSSRLRPA
jgi:hypothetical protein